MTESASELLTSEVCINLIEKKLQTKEFKLLNYTIRPLSEGIQGLTGSHWIATCDVLINNTLTTHKFFLKLRLALESDSIMLKMMADGNDIYMRESEFLKLLTKMPVDWAPKFYDFLNNKLLILEDLSERKFEMCKVQTYDLDHCRVVLNTLANFQAFSFKYMHDRRKENKDYSILKEYPYFFKDLWLRKNPITGRNWVKATKESSNFIIDQLPKEFVTEVIKRKIDQMFDEFSDYLTPTENRYKVISHGDLWGNNIMFHYENGLPQKSCLVDFQTLRYLPPTNDVHIMLGINTTPEFREKHMTSLMNYYYQQLYNEIHKIGLDPNEVYPKDVFESSCQETIVPALMVVCAYKMLMLMNPVSVSEYHTNNPLELYVGDRVQFIKKELAVDPDYKRNILNEYQELIKEVIKL